MGFEGAEPIAEKLGELVAGWRMVDETDLSSLRIADWDLIVVRGTGHDWARFDPASHLFALNFGAPSGRLRVAPQKHLIAEYTGSTASREMHLISTAPSPMLRLIRQHLLPLLEELHRRPYMETSNGFNASVVDLREHDYLREPDGAPIVGHYPRRPDVENTGWCLQMPLAPAYPELWLTEVMALWREIAPVRFPERAEWRSLPSYMTRRQLAAHEAMTSLDAARAAAEQEYDRRKAELEGEASSAVVEAEGGQLRLLLSDGDDLASAAITAFETLGFRVTDADDALGAGIARSEDLRLADPDEPDWTNITEVKGHTGGARGSVLLKLGSWATRFALSHGAPPTTRWYVANQFRNEDPRTRQITLRGAEDDLAVFGQDGGLVIDTRDLFELQREVLAGTLPPGDARKMLRTARGRFQLNAQSCDEDSSEEQADG